MLETEEDTPLVVELAAEHLLGDLLTFAVDQPPISGTVDLPDLLVGSFTYTPTQDFAGADPFVLRIDDSQGFSSTLPLTVTVLPVNDAPAITVPVTMAVAVGEAVEVPVEVDDVEGSEVTVTVEGLPPGLEWNEDAIRGVVAVDAEAASPYFTTVRAVDADGSEAVAFVEWTVTLFPQVESPLAPEEGAAEDEESTQAPDTETENGETEGEVPPVDGEPVDGEPVDGEPTGNALTLPATTYVMSRSGANGLEGYAWQAPLDFGNCPMVEGALVAQATDPALALPGDVAATPDSAPALDFLVESAGVRRLHGLRLRLCA